MIRNEDRYHGFAFSFKDIAKLAFACTIGLPYYITKYAIKKHKIKKEKKNEKVNT